jgi:hypothetical protein
VFIDSEADDSSVTQVLKTFPESKLIFASHGKYLLEIPVEKGWNLASAGFRDPVFLPFACVKTTRSATRPALASVQA